MGESAEVAVIGSSPFMLHKFEEPVVSGVNGTAAIFFCGCNLGCVYCQNSAVSRKGRGKELSESELADLFVQASGSGAHTLSLITGGHFVRQTAAALKRAKPFIKVPVVWNSGGYELPASVELLEGLVDVFLPDFKYLNRARAARYSGAPDYGQRATECIRKMTELAPQAVISDGIIQKGVIIRHLVMPGGRADGINIMNCIKDNFPDALVSVMRQYTPEFCPEAFPEIKRKVTSFEYDSVVEAALRAGLKGFMQQKGCENSSYTPDFD